MSSKIPWSLPEGVDEILPDKALKVEKFRRDLLDLYISSGYEYIIPPLLEFKKNIGGNAHEEIVDYAFSFKDDLSCLARFAKYANFCPKSTDAAPKCVSKI